MRWRGKMNVPFLFAQGGAATAGALARGNESPFLFAQVAFTSFSACDKWQAGKKLGIAFLSPRPMSQGFTHC